MFGRARLKLTAFYTGTVLIIVLFFSFGVLVLFDLDFFGEYELAPEGDHYNISKQVEIETDRRIFRAIAIVDPSIIILTLALSWFLAGKTLQPMQETLKRQKRFVSDAAHELRTPLSIMKAGLETMEISGPSTVEDYRTLNHELREEIDRIVQLTNDLLFLSRGDHSAEVTGKEAINISAICARNLQLMKPYAAQKGIQTDHEIESGIRCLGDKNQVSHLVLNLLKNAVDYNREGGRVMLQLTKSGKKVILKVSDTGIGIATEHIRHVFDRFYKADDSRERSDNGTGLGLSIVNMIVRDHGGHIKIDSELGQGTRVTVELCALEGFEIPSHYRSP